MMPQDRRQSTLSRRQDELDRELVRFIDFGLLLDRRTRRYLAEIIRHRALGEATPQLPPLLATSEEGEEDLDVTYTRYFADAVGRIFSDDALLSLCQSHGALNVQVATETLRWMRTTFRRLEQGSAHAEERSRLGALAGLPLPRFVKTRQHILEDLSSRYSPHELDAAFYRSAFDEVLGRGGLASLSPAEAARVEMLLHDLLAAWDALLSAKLLAAQLDELSESQHQFTERITKRVTEHRRIQAIFTPFVDYLDRGWDLSRELWEAADLDLLAEYASLLEKEDDLRKLAEMLGRMQEAEIQIDEEEISRTIVTQRWITDRTQRAEIVGVVESDDLSQVLSSEVALASEPLLEDRFLQKLVDKRLLTFAFADHRLVEGSEVVTSINRRSRRRSKGPFIICVDTSYSMAGRAELLAKVLSFGILRVAIEEDREAFLINFSVQFKTLDLRDAGRQVDTLAAFLRMSFHGGTDVTLALGEALRQLQDGRYKDADVLVVSDFIMFRMARSIVDSIESQRHNHGTRFHALTFQDVPGKSVLDCFDTSWFSDPEKPGSIVSVADHLRTIRQS